MRRAHQGAPKVSTERFITVALEPVGGPGTSGAVVVPEDFLAEHGELPPVMFLTDDRTAISATYDRDAGDDRMRWTTRPDGSPGWLVLARYRYRPGSDLYGAPDGPPVAGG